MITIEAEQTKLSFIEQILQQVYPVGSLYISTNEVNPKDLFGFGIWEQIKDKFLLSSGDMYKPGFEGGESEVILTTEQTPAHTHTRGTMNITGALTERPCTSSSEILNSKPNGAFTSVISGDDVQWGITVVTEGKSTHKNNLHKFDASRSWTGATSSVGNNKAHNNMPPYLTVCIYKRIK